MPKNFNVGIDIGQKIDHSAVCLVERSEDKAVVRLLVKYPLGTAYTKVVETVRDMVFSVGQQGVIESFTVDATGIGAAPAAMFEEALPHLRVDSFIFTNKSKRELIGKVKVMHAFGRLKFAARKGDEQYARTLAELMAEMKQLQAKVLREGDSNPEIEIFKTGQHDDLFTALALAVKDIEFPQGQDYPPIQYVKDDTWVHTPLEASSETPIYLF